MTVLETERLILRPPIQADLDGWAEFMADPEAQRYLGGVQPRAMAWRHMATMAGAWSLLGFSMFSVLRKDTGEWIGRIGPWRPEGWPGTEIGWSLLTSAWGQGFAYEAAAASADWAFDHLGWTDMIHTIDPENAASIALARRLGSGLIGPGRLAPPNDMSRVDIYGQTREQWLAKRSLGT
jgi:RimJ/RimL family protein N-acetyltransferase